jgi:hypothetical protein
MEEEEKKPSKAKEIWSYIGGSIMIFMFFVGIYLMTYYHSVDVEAYLSDRGQVKVEKFDYGTFYDGPGESEAMIFYPGARVATNAYAPLMQEFAENGIDCFLIDMPFHMAFIGKHFAGNVQEDYDYDTWYFGGHSLGGAMIADYAASHMEDVDGLLLLAAYPTKDISDADISVLTIYGSEDGILNMDKVAECRDLLPKESVEICIEGGNHAQFGSYGEQKGDGQATISGEEQRRQTVEAFLKYK